MNIRLSLLAPALFLIPTLGMAQQDSADCTSMLATAVGMQLEQEGFDTANACDLTVAQLAEIKNLLETEGMGSRPRIQQILADAG